MGINSFAGHFFEITDVVFFLFLNRHHRTTSQNNTRQHAHSTDSSHFKTLLHLPHRNKPTSFQVARGLHLHSKTRTVVSCMMRTCSPSSVPRYMHSFPKGKAGPCVLRESPTGRVIIVIVAEREEREDKREREKRKKDIQKEEREQERQRRRKTHPCVRSKRLRVCGQDVSVCSRKTPACSTHYFFWN